MQPNVSPPMKQAWLIRPQGLFPYGAAYDLMHRLAERRAENEVPDTLILLEHPPVYTAGRRSDPSHVRWTEAEVEAAGAELLHVDRGGSVTFHGPGQLVGYPIVGLGARPGGIGYRWKLEEVVIRGGAGMGVGVGSAV